MSIVQMTYLRDWKLQVALMFRRLLHLLSSHPRHGWQHHPCPQATVAYVAIRQRSHISGLNGWLMIFCDTQLNTWMRIIRGCYRAILINSIPRRVDFMQKCPKMTQIKRGRCHSPTAGEDPAYAPGACLEMGAKWVWWSVFNWLAKAHSAFHLELQPPFMLTCLEVGIETAICHDPCDVWIGSHMDMQPGPAELGAIMHWQVEGVESGLQRPRGAVKDFHKDLQLHKLYIIYFPACSCWSFKKETQVSHEAKAPSTSAACAACAACAARAPAGAAAATGATGRTCTEASRCGEASRCWKHTQLTQVLDNQRVAI